MLIEIHCIQNHSPANLNRDDLGAPKTCYFGGVLRSRISSQCIKRSIRMSPQFRALLGGKRTRQLARLIAERCTDKDARKRAEKILELCGLKPKKGKQEQGDSSPANSTSKMLVYTTDGAIAEMAALLQKGGLSDDVLKEEFSKLIAERTSVPDMALSGRMLETGEIENTTVEAALQVAHAISTHEARPEVDYYVAKDDVPGEDAGAGYVDEAMFASACFYKYFSINWETLLSNLKGDTHLAAHTVGAFLRGAALTNPSGKQNAMAAHNLPDAILVEIKDTPISYANAFAKPVAQGERDIIEQSIAKLGQYVWDIQVGYGQPKHRFWFSPNLRHSLCATDTVIEKDKKTMKLRKLATEENMHPSLDSLVTAVISAIGYDWKEVQKTVLNAEAGS